MRLSEEEFQAVVRQALASIPATFQAYLMEVAVEVEDLPSRRTAAELGVPRDELYGAYFGTPLPLQSVDSPPELPPKVVLYRRNLELGCASRDELLEEIRITVLHEVGHHFGLDEDQLDDLGYG